MKEKQPKEATNVCWRKKRGENRIEWKKKKGGKK